MLRSINPVNGKTLAQYSFHNVDEVNSIIDNVHRARKQWQNIGFERRGELMKQLAKIMIRQKDEHAAVITREMGKPFKQSVSEIEKCAWVCEYYADHAERFLSHEYVVTSADKSYIAYQPLGVILAVMPWNFPFWQVFRFAAPALMAGNAALLKHSSGVTGTALAIEKLFQKAGFPEHLFRTLKINSETVEKVIANPMVKAVTLTGSTEAGKSVASIAGRYIKKTVLELGGSDPYIVLEDADLDLAASTCVQSRLINGGQSCIAAKRFIVVKEVYDEFLEKFVNQMKSKTMGDPFEEQTDLGPMAQLSLRDQLHEQVADSIAKGAVCLAGGNIPDMPGAWYPATVLANVGPGMPAYDNELFGPVAAVIQAAGQDEAIRIANDTVFGLGAAIFTRDVERGQYIAEHLLQAGSCFVNAAVQSDPRLPFGGVEQSGYGRELSWAGIREFTNMKTVWVKRE